MLNKMPNQDDVQYAASNLGYEKLFANEKPANVVKNESANSSIRFNNRGARLNLDSSAGETVDLTLGEWSVNPFSHVILDGYFTPVEAPSGHNITVGMFSTLTGTDGYKWDLTNEEIIVGFSSEPAPVSISAYDRVYFRFDIDVGAKETTFFASSGGSTTDKVTVQAAIGQMGSKILAAETVSGGSGTIALQNMRLSLYR